MKLECFKVLKNSLITIAFFWLARNFFTGIVFLSYGKSINFCFLSDTFLFGLWGMLGWIPYLVYIFIMEGKSVFNRALLISVGGLVFAFLHVALLFMGWSDNYLVAIYYGVNVEFFISFCVVLCIFFVKTWLKFRKLATKGGNTSWKHE